MSQDLGVKAENTFSHQTGHQAQKMCWSDPLWSGFYGAQCVRQTFAMEGLSNLVWLAGYFLGSPKIHATPSENKVVRLKGYTDPGKGLQNFKQQLEKMRKLVGLMFGPRNRKWLLKIRKHIFGVFLFLSAP